MKKVMMAGLMLATSVSAMADNTTHNGLITNLQSVYANVGGTWGTADSDNATTALGSLFQYADSVGTGYTPPTVTFDANTGLSASGGSVGVAFVESEFEGKIDGVVTGVTQDIFGTDDLNKLSVQTSEVTGHMSLMVGSNTDHDTSTTYTALTGLASEELTAGFTFINGLVDDVNNSPLTVTQSTITNAITGANAAFSFVNTGVSALSSISDLNDATQTASSVDGYRLGADNGVVTYNSQTFCSYENYAKGISEADGDCSN